MHFIGVLNRDGGAFRDIDLAARYGGEEFTLLLEDSKREGGRKMAERARRAVESLPADERDPILLAYFGGRTYREAAELLGQPEGTVKSRIRVGLRTLRTALAAQGVTA